MSTFSSDLGQTDPCARAGIGGKDGGTAIKHDIGGTKSEKPVNVMLQCSPLLTMHAGILSADNLIREHFGGPKFVNSSIARPYFMGNRPGNFSSDGRWLETKGFPYIHGEIAEKLRLQAFEGDKAIRGALFAAAGGLTGALATSAIVCAVGGIPSLGIAVRSGRRILGGAVICAVTWAAGSVIKDFLEAQFNRIEAMSNADWFVWSNTRVFWDSFGSITDTTIDPSLVDPNVNPFHHDEVRIGVEWSNVPLGQGPTFFSAKDGGGGGLRAKAELSTRDPRTAHAGRSAR